ncbi:transposase, partial [Streptomyces sp. NRRL S-813]|uniref:transposase n=1 Tax=Streptomyces sp. NRRL S-813 TaxID=1463919 RepID=UPI00055F2DCB
AVAVTRTIRAAIETIGADAWKPIKYTDAIWDEEDERWISDAEIAEIPFTAFTSKKKTFHTTARLIVRRVKRLNAKTVPTGQSELFAVWRHHVIFIDSPFVLTDAEPMHRDHAAVEQIFADLEDSALAHLPSGKFTANAAWLTLAAAAYNLTRAAGHLASVFHARARTGTIRRHLIAVPARITRPGRRLVLHLPQRWHWADDFTDLWTATGQRMQT